MAAMVLLTLSTDDPDFPSHRAAHRQFLRDTSKFKEVVKFTDRDIRNKIQYTHRLLYLKDVVLARILDDPTFSVLNSLIFFHHVDIIQYITSDDEHCQKLFAIIKDEEEPMEKKKIAVLFIQNCCAVAKNIQPANREKLYMALIKYGLFSVVNFALRHHDASVRVAGTDIFVSLIDSDPSTVRVHMNEEGNGTDGSLMHTLIELLLVEVDLGVKSQMADAIKILLDPTLTHAALESMHRHGAEGNKRGSMQHSAYHQAQQQQYAEIHKIFVGQFYASCVQRLFQPFNDLEHREDMNSLTVQELNLYTHLVEIVCFFARHHGGELSLFVRSENLHAKIARLLRSRKKYMRLVALKWFRTCIGLPDSTHRDEMMREQLFEPILDIVYETMPRDNLLNSACLEIFDYIRGQNIRPLLQHLGSLYRDRLHAITYVPTFRALLAQYEENVRPSRILEADNSFTTEPDTPPLGSHHPHLSNRRQLFESFSGKPGNDADFPDDDDDFDGDMIDDDESALPMAPILRSQPNGRPTSKAPLVDYPDDDDEDDDEDDDDRGRHVDLLASSPDPQREKKSSDDTNNSSDLPRLEGFPDVDNSDSHRGRKRSVTPRSSSDDCARPHRSSQSSLTPIKRRRSDAEDEDDELGKLMTRAKRRNSSASTTPNNNNKSQRNTDLSPPFGPDDVHHGEDSGGQSPTLPADSPTQDTTTRSGPGHGHTLRRKGSMKSKNESSTAAHTNGNSKVSIKLSLGGSKGHHPHSHSQQHQKTSASSRRNTSNEDEGGG
jgi:protein phosphatase-4 regulatory subunit 3